MIRACWEGEGSDVKSENIYAPRELWFVDKNTGEKAIVTAEYDGLGNLSFSYQGKQHTIPVSMLGNRIYVYLPGKPQAKIEFQEKKEPQEKREPQKKEEPRKKEGSNKELFYQGEYFRFEAGKWVSHNGSTPKEKYQQRLSDVYQKRCKHYSHSVKELVAFARKQKKDTDGINTAIRAFEIALPQATAGQASSFLATLCSLYRQTGASSAAISLYDYAVEKHGKRVETSPFLTSVAAAFMDAGDIEMAEILKRKLETRDSGNEKLTNFTRRFDAETRLE